MRALGRSKGSGPCGELGERSRLKIESAVVPFRLAGHHLLSSTAACGHHRGDAWARMKPLAKTRRPRPPSRPSNRPSVGIRFVPPRPAARGLGAISAGLCAGIPFALRAGADSSCRDHRFVRRALVPLLEWSARRSLVAGALICIILFSPPHHRGRAIGFRARMFQQLPERIASFANAAPLVYVFRTSITSRRSSSISAPPTGRPRRCRSDAEPLLRSSPARHPFAHPEFFACW